MNTVEAWAADLKRVLEGYFFDTVAEKVCVVKEAGGKKQERKGHE